jgi:lipopolysaccharide export system protein LptA
MILLKRILITFILVSSSLFAQVESEMIRVVGDSLLGKVINGESVREIYGNVVLTQGNVVITCDEAVQYIARNDAILKGNVVARQDSLTITTPEGFYFGNERRTKSTAGIILDDQKVILEADSGEYFFDDDKAFFQTNVILFDSVMTLFADELTYFQKEDRALAIGNVKIIDATNEIIADKLEHFRRTKISIADDNVKIRSLENSTLIFGDHLEDYPENKYTLINKNPILIQYDTSYVSETDFTVDTLIIKAHKMEAYRDTANIFKAIDSVKIIKGGFASINDFTIYLRDTETIITKKVSEDAGQPILWFENSQLTGDSITIYIDDKKIKELDVIGKAFMLSQNKKYKERFDQTSSKNVRLFFADNKLLRAEFEGNVLSIYYLYEVEEANGLTKSSAKDVTIVFEDNEVNEVRMYGAPSSEYYPEKQVVGNERAFTLPKFIFYKNRPNKFLLLKNIQ